MVRIPPPYLQGSVQSFRHIKLLQLLVIFGQMLPHWLTDKIIILQQAEEKKKECFNEKLNLLLTTKPAETTFFDCVFSFFKL